MIIYGDILFAENLITGGVLLYISSLIHGGTKGTLRIAAGSVMCGLFSFVIFLQQPSCILIFMQIIFAFSVNAVSFGRKNLIVKSITFLLVTYFAGGITMAVLIVTKNPFAVSPAGVYTPDMKASVLMISMALCITFAKQIIKTVRNYRFINQNSMKAIIICGEERISTMGFVDTGNSLRDPVGGSPVVLADKSLWQKMKEKGMICPERFRVIPYEAVGIKGTLQAARVDAVILGEKKWNNCIVAHNNGGFHFKTSEGTEVELLISGYMTGEGR